MKKPAPQALLGQSVSHGTLRPIDLFESFIATLMRIEPASSLVFRSVWQKEIKSLYSDDTDDADDGVGEMLDALQQALNDRAPEGYYFGAIEGDGSDFGFWGES